VVVGRPAGQAASSERVLLVGLMATGKTAVGTALADQLGWRYLDNDTLVAAAAGAALDPLVRARGVTALRVAEAAALDAVLAEEPPLVAGVAAGVVEDPTGRRRLADADATVVWLRARPETLAARVGAGGSRPWLRPDPLTAFTLMATRRADSYAAVADLVVDVDGVDAPEVARRIAAHVTAARGEPS
jgi:shikimate kinase